MIKKIKMIMNDLLKFYLLKSTDVKEVVKSKL